MQQCLTHSLTTGARWQSDVSLMPTDMTDCKFWNVAFAISRMVMTWFTHQFQVVHVASDPWTKPYGPSMASFEYDQWLVQWYQHYPITYIRSYFLLLL